jgi:predicted RNA-binding Zn-ribbon protein involved in translation (DUF1610 family)
MLQLDTHILYITHINYIRKNIIGEKNVIHNVLYNNSFPIQPWKIPRPKQNQTRSSQIEIPKQKWATFTDIGKENTYITKIFKHTNIKIAYRTNNTIQENLTPKTHNHEIFSATGVYKLTCPDCGKAYIGQTGRTSSKDIMNTYASSETNCNSS